MAAIPALPVFALAARHAPRTGVGWKAVTLGDLRITATDIGEPGADAAILFREGELDDDDQGTSLKVYVRVKIFTEHGRRYADVQLPYRTDLGKIVEVHARTVRPDGSIVPVDSRDIFDKLLLTTSHGVWRAKTFSLPSVEAGSIIEYRYRHTYPAGFRYFALDLQSDMFIKELVYRIKPADDSTLDVRWVTFNANRPDRFTPVWDGTYNIKAENIQPFRKEALMPPEQAVKMWGWLYYSKDTATDPTKYWRQYGEDMYYRMVAETRPTPVLDQVVQAIVLPSDGVEEKIARVYDYVQREIQNVAPADFDREKLKSNDTAYQTLRRRYGTPRDINRLFIALLKAAGLDARVAELTTRDENFFHRSFADSFQLNGEVTAVLKPDGNIAFYDPGTPRCLRGVLAWEKEGVPALLYDPDAPRFVETPITLAANSSVTRVLTVSPLSDGRVTVHSEATLAGHRAMDCRKTLWGLVPAEQHKRMAALIRAKHDGAVLDEATIKIAGLDDLHSPVKVSCDFTAAAFAPPTEKRILLMPALLAAGDTPVLEGETRTNSVYLHYPWSQSDRMLIDVPAGFSPEQLPPPVNMDIGAAVYNLSFHLEGRRIVCERKLFVNGIIFKPDEYATLKSFFDRVHQSDRSVISLKR